MNLTAFQKLRSGLRRHGAPVAGRDLLSFELRLRTALEEVGVFADVEVERTPDQDRLLVALCSYRGDLTWLSPAFAWNQWEEQSWLSASHVALRGASFS